MVQGSESIGNESSQGLGSVKGATLFSVSPKTDVKEVARCFTRVAFDQFCAIKPPELMKRNWQVKEKSPAFSALVDNFARYQGWAVREILMAKDKERGKIISCLVELAHACLELNNFHVCFALYAGVAHPSVSRLKVWEKKMDKVKERLAILAALFDPSMNHKAYQNALKNARPPLVPQVSVYSKYLFAIEETNNDWVTTNWVGSGTVEMEEKLVNIDKLRMLYLLVKQLRQYQRVR